MSRVEKFDFDSDGTGKSESFISFTRDCEDVLIWHALSGTSPGTYFDLGASKCGLGSTTQILHSIGWTGVNICLDDAALASLLTDRPRDVSLGFDCALSAIQLATGKPVKGVRVNGMNLLSVVSQFLNLTDVHFVRVHSQLLDPDDFEKVGDFPNRPWVLLCDLSGTTDLERQSWDLTRPKGYHHVWQGRNSLCFVSEDHPEVEMRLGSVALIVNKEEDSRLRKDIQWNQAQINILTDQLQWARDDLKSMEASLSWKLSSPLRFLDAIRRSRGNLWSLFRKRWSKTLSTRAKSPSKDDHILDQVLSRRARLLFDQIKEVEIPRWTTK